MANLYTATGVKVGRASLYLCHDPAGESPDGEPDYLVRFRGKVTTGRQFMRTLDKSTRRRVRRDLVRAGLRPVVLASL